MLRFAALAFAVAIVASVAGVVALDARRERVAEARLAAIRAEQQRLERELELLEDVATPANRVVYVGSTSDADYFVDLRALEERSAFAAEPAVERASFQPGL
ncbi:MAG: hypothetical protein ACRD2J_02520 [Thermoanaerobaculia bacterium]